jgi:hypothetical protein
LIIIGVVAYQNKPGAPSHFDIPLLTLMKFLGPRSLVPRQHIQEVVGPSIQADEIDPACANFKHQVAIHGLRKWKN